MPASRPRQTLDPQLAERRQAAGSSTRNTPRAPCPAAPSGADPARDTLVVVRLDRLARSLSHLLQVIESLGGPEGAFPLTRRSDRHGQAAGPPLASDDGGGGGTGTRASGPRRGCARLRRRAGWAATPAFGQATARRTASCAWPATRAIQEAREHDLRFGRLWRALSPPASAKTGRSSG